MRKPDVESAADVRAAQLILEGATLDAVMRITGLSRWRVYLAARRAKGGATGLVQARRRAAGAPAPLVDQPDLRRREFRGAPVCPACCKPMLSCRC